MRKRILYLIVLIAVLMTAGCQSSGDPGGQAEESRPEENRKHRPQDRSQARVPVAEPHEWRLSVEKYLSDRYPTRQHPHREKLEVVVEQVLTWVWKEGRMGPVFETDLYIPIGEDLKSEAEERDFSRRWPVYRKRYDVVDAKTEEIEFWGDFALVDYIWIRGSDHKENRTFQILWFWDRNRWRIIPIGYLFNYRVEKWMSVFVGLAVQINSHREWTIRKEQEIPKYNTEKFLYRVMRLAEEAARREGYFPFDMFYLLLYEESLKIRKYAYDRMDERYDVPVEFTRKRFEYSFESPLSEWKKAWHSWWENTDLDLEYISPYHYVPLDE